MLFKTFYVLLQIVMFTEKKKSCTDKNVHVAL